MQFNFLETELSYLIKRFNYTKIVGLRRCIYNEDQVKHSLLDKGYLIQFSGREELSNPVRILFSAWSKARYSVVRSDCNGEDNSLFILANEEVILFVSIFEQKVSVEMSDFSEHNMDSLLYHYLQLCKDGYDSRELNITLTVEDFVTLFLTESKIGMKHTAGKLGLSFDEVYDLCSAVQLEPQVVLVIQDMKNNTGSLNMIHSIKNKLVMIKHITPEDRENQRVVVVQGDLRAIVDSIYIL